MNSEAGEERPPVDCPRCDTEAPDCEHSLSDDERAVQFLRYVDWLCETHNVDRERIRVFRTKDDDKKQLRVFELGKGIFENPKRTYYEHSVEEAFEAIRAGASGFGLYLGREDCGTENIGVIDNDDADIWPYDTTPTDYAILSGSGEGYHHPFVHDGSVENANSKKETPYEGSVRTGNYYHLVPGSIHPSGGVYTIAWEDDIPVVTQEDFPEDLKPRKATAYGPGGEKIEIPKDPDTDLRDAEFENELGWSLETVREKSDKLDELLTRLSPPGYDGDRSTADAAAVNYLWYWGFNEQQIGRIIRKYRRYEKTERDDYLYEHTIPFAAGGEDRITNYFDEDGNYDPDPMSILPLERLDRLSHQERVRYAKKRGIEWPDVEEVRDRLKDTILEAVENEEVTVKSAPTGSGKTYTVATTPWQGVPENIDGNPTIHAHRTREARDQAREESEEAGLNAYTLKGRDELCPSAAGDHDPETDESGEVVGSEGITIDGYPLSEWISHRCNRQGLPFSVVHQWANSEVHDGLPCEEGDTECAAKGQFDGIPRNENGSCEYDIIHCTHQFLMVPSMRMHTNIFIDEKPAFGMDVGTQDGALSPHAIRESINAYLDFVDAPVDNYSELVFAAEHGHKPGENPARNTQGLVGDEYKKWFRDRMDVALSTTGRRVECARCGGEGTISDRGEHSHDISEFDTGRTYPSSDECPECEGDGKVWQDGGEPPLTWYRENMDAHALAPAFARAVWNAEEGPAGRKHARVAHNPPRFDTGAHDSAAWNRVYVDIVLDDQWEIVDGDSMPDFTLANSVVGLDAHPQKRDPNWMVKVHPDIETEFTLSTEERTLYRRYERGLFTVQIGEGTQPVTNGNWLDEGQGKKFDAIIKHLREQYGEDFRTAITSMSAKPTIRGSMEEAGISEPEMMHYGEEESRNDFAGEDVGLVVGSIDPGDEPVINLLARLGMNAEPCYKECPVCEGDGLYENDDGEEDICETCTGEGEVREHGRTFEGPDAEMADAVLQGVREHHVAQSAGRWARNADDPEDNATVFIVTEAAPAGFIDAKAPGVTWTTNSDQRDRLEYVRDNPDGVTAKELSEEFDCTKQTAYRTLKTAEGEGILEKTAGVGPYGADVYSPSESFSPDGSVDLGQSPGQSLQPTYDTIDTYTVAIDALPNCAYNTPEGEEREWLHQSTLRWYEPVSDPPS